MIAKLGYNPAYGARPLRRALQDHVEDDLSTGLLSGEINVGDDVTVGAHQGKITFKVKKPDEDKAVELKLNK